MNSLDWNDLRHFLAVARNGSTIAASKALNVSQSTVHRHLTELENSIGRHVVIRHATGYRLTELGKDLQPFAQRVEDAVLAFEREVRASEEAPHGPVRLTCSESIGYRLLRSMLLDRLRDRHPGLNVELVMSDHFLDLSKGEADVAIRAGEPDDDTLVGRKIADVPWAVYASRSYIERHGGLASTEEMNKHAVIGFDGDIENHHAARWLRAVAPQSRIAARSNTVAGLLLTVRSGIGLAPLPIPLACQDAELLPLLGPVPGLFSPIYLLTHPDLRRTPRIRVVFDYIIAELESVRHALGDEAT